MELMRLSDHITDSDGNKILRRTDEISTRAICPNCNGNDRLAVEVSETYPERETVYDYVTCPTCNGDKVVDKIEIVTFLNVDSVRYRRIKPQNH